VLWVRCREAGGAPPFWPWTQDFLVAELARAVGLGGRDRRAASHAERARLNATRAIRAARASVSLWWNHQVEKRGGRRGGSAPGRLAGTPSFGAASES
jgi:hypothetical protein